MNLELWPDDLRPEAESVHLQNLSFEHFKPDVQQAILLVGRAVFYRWARDGYHAIYPPKAALQSAASPGTFRTPLAPGSVVEFAGIRATVVADRGGTGRSLTVDVEGEGRMDWYWHFDGETCQVVSTPKQELIADRSRVEQQQPEVEYQCRACGSVWARSQVMLDPRRTGVFTCRDVFCGGTVDRQKS